MNRIVSLFLALTLAGSALAQAPEMPKPTRHHDWLKQLEGEWTAEGEMSMGPGKPPLKSTGRETVKMLGGFFVVATGEGEMMGVKNQTLMQIGYDVKKHKYVGSWAMSADGTFWIYEGWVDKSGKSLALYTTGPNVMTQKGTAKYRETMTIVDADHRTFTSEILDKKSKGTKLVEVKYTRVKK